MSKEKRSYSDKPLGQRLLFFFAGFCNFLMGYALYYIFKDDKTKEWQINFIQRGAAFGLAFIIIGGIIAIIESIVTGTFPIN